MSCRDIIKNISEVLSDKYKIDNFLLKNNVFEKIISSQKKYRYIIDVKKCCSGYSLHLISGGLIPRRSAAVKKGIGK
jgi:hypothetical protein